jgi:2-dehydro-3-deoxyglucarate aldolase
LSKSLKQKLAEGDLTVGGWIMIGHPAVGEIMARAGYDFVTVDIEHSAITISEMENIIRAIQYGGAPAIVRLTNNDENLIKRVMDSGATGIIIPLVRTAEEMHRGVAAMYYPPGGTRGVGLARAQKYGFTNGLPEYQAWLTKEGVCIAQIEHIDAVENLEDILSVPGVDGYILGPYDLSASMGLIGQLDHPDVKTAIARVCEIGKKLGKPGGIHVVEPDQERLKEAIAQGFTFLAYSIDTRIIDITVRSALKAVKG